MEGMVSENYVTDVAGIQSTLHSIFSSLEGNFTRSTSTNRIVLASPESEARLIDELVDTLATTQPGRFFVLVREENRKEMHVSISARCHQLDKGQAICSEVITIRYAPGSDAAVPSVVRSYLLTGRRTELILLEAAPIHSTYKEYAAIADVLILNSRSLWNERAFLTQIPGEYERAIDIQWLLLAPWREAIRNVFDSHVRSGELQNLREIRIGTTTDLAVQPFLIAGWLIQALQMGVSCFASDGFECSGPHNESLRLSITREVDGVELDLHSVRFLFDNSELPEICWRRSGDVIIGEACAAQDGFKISRQVDTGSASDALSRYFLVGESTVRYAGALQIALEMSQLKNRL